MRNALRKSLLRSGSHAVTMMPRFFFCAFLSYLLIVGSHVRLSSAAVPLENGARIVILGAGWVEGLQQDDYWETILTTRLDATDIIFRNQGWAGDTVQGIARAVFGTPEDGFARLLRDLRQVEPTHILIAYGNNEAYDSVENLDHFVRHWHRLLDELSATGARLIVLLPPRRIRPTSALPDPAEYNSNLDQYRNVMLQTCQQRKIASLDLALSEAWKYTTDGIRLTPTGYWILAQDLASYLGYPQPPWELHLDANRRSYDAVNVSVQQLFFTTNQVRWVSVDRYLPVPHPPHLPDGMQVEQGKLTVRNLPEGQYQLVIDDLPVLCASAQLWHRGVSLPVRGGWQQVEQLRAVIREKNQLYFHRYRPQNETYLFLFRKHEQGNNAVEIPQFDPLIAEKEKQIEQLKRPTPHVYQLLRLP